MSLLRKILYQPFMAWIAITRPVTVGVRLLLVKDGRVLLVQHTYQDGWFLVGGGVTRNETLEQAARREALEEAGAQLGDLRLFGIYTNLAEGRSDHITVFVCEEFTVSGHHDSEIARVEFFNLNSLPDAILPGHRRRVEEYQRGDILHNRFGLW